MKFVLSFFAALILTACAGVPPAEVDSQLGAWKGAHIDELIQAWGVPTGERTINDVRYAEWRSRRISSSPAISVGVGGGGNRGFGSVGTTVGGGPEENTCFRQAAYDQQGIVTRLTWNGDATTCSEAIPPRYPQKN